MVINYDAGVDPVVKLVVDVFGEGLDPFKPIGALESSGIGAPAWADGQKGLLFDALATENSPLNLAGDDDAIKDILRNDPFSISDEKIDSPGFLDNIRNLSDCCKHGGDVGRRYISIQINNSPAHAAEYRRLLAERGIPENDFCNQIRDTLKAVIFVNSRNLNPSLGLTPELERETGTQVDNAIQSFIDRISEAAKPTVPNSVLEAKRKKEVFSQVQGYLSSGTPFNFTSPVFAGISPEEQTKLDNVPDLVGKLVNLVSGIDPYEPGQPNPLVAVDYKGVGRVKPNTEQKRALNEFAANTWRTRSVDIINQCTLILDAAAAALPPPIMAPVPIPPAAPHVPLGAPPPVPVGGAPAAVPAVDDSYLRRDGNHAKISEEVEKFIQRIIDAVPHDNVKEILKTPPSYGASYKLAAEELAMQKEIAEQLTKYDPSQPFLFKFNKPVFSTLSDEQKDEMKETIQRRFNRLEKFLNGNHVGGSTSDILHYGGVGVTPIQLETARKWAKTQVKVHSHDQFSVLSLQLDDANKAVENSEKKRNDAKLAELEEKRDDLAGKLTKHAGSEAQFSSAQKDNETKAKKVHEGRKHKRHVGAAIGLVAGIGIASIVGIATGGIGFFPTLLLIGGCMALGAGIKHFTAWRKERSLEKKAEKNKHEANRQTGKVKDDITKMKDLDRNIVAHGGVKPDDTPEQIADRARGLGK